MSVYDTKAEMAQALFNAIVATKSAIDYTLLLSVIMDECLANGAEDERVPGDA